MVAMRALFAFFSFCGILCIFLVWMYSFLGLVSVVCGSVIFTSVMV